MNTIIYILGVCTAIYIGFYALALVYYILKAFAASCSWHRWAIKCSRVHGGEIYWSKVPLGFIVLWWQLVGETSVTYSSDKGKWEGIGKWVVYTKSEVKNMWEEEL